MNRYDHYPGDYSRDTKDLNLTQHGAYRMLLDAYYSTERPIPDAAKFRVVGAFTEEEQKETQWVLDRFFNLEDGVWHHERADREIAKAQPKIRAAKENGKSGGRPRKTQSVISENPVGSFSVTQEKPTGEPNRNPDGEGEGEGEDLNKIRGAVQCPAALRLTEDQAVSLEVELIPRWAVDLLQGSLVANWSQDPDQPKKTVANWRKYLAGAIRGRWRDPTRRPKKPEKEREPGDPDPEGEKREAERLAREAAYSAQQHARLLGDQTKAAS